MATGAAYMNATPHHSKVRASLTLSSPLFVAGQDVTGKMEMECRGDKDVGIGIIMVELFATQELNSRDHSATSTFVHARRMFQGQGLPPSNAVNAHPAPGDLPLPPSYWPARRGVTTFFFKFPTPISSPSSISFASGLAKIRYEIRASIGVSYRGEKRVVTNSAEADIVQCQDMDGTAAEHVVVAENGKMYVQGKIIGSRIISGQQACLELQVKNHTSKKTTGLSLTLMRHLHLHGAVMGSRTPLQLSDTLFSQNFRGAEYLVQPGIEGVANLVFDVPKAARTVKGGIRDGTDDDQGGRKRTEPLFEIRCILGVKIGMGIGNKDVVFEMPVQLSHPAALPESDATTDPYISPELNPYAVSPGIYGHQSPRAMSPVFEPPNPYYARSPGPDSGTPSPLYPYVSPPIPSSSASPPINYYPVSPPIPPFALPLSPHQHLWSPPPPDMSPIPHYHHNHHDHRQMYYYPPPPIPLVPFAYPARPNSVGARPIHNTSPPSGLPSGLPGVDAVGPLYPSFQQSPYQNHEILDVPHDPHNYDHDPIAVVDAAEEGKGERASRISHHLRTTTRARSMSPTSHRFPAPATVPPPEIPASAAVVHATSPRYHGGGPPVLSPRPILSPRGSVAGEVVINNTSPDANGTARSVRVDMLERMVDLAPGDEGKSVEEVLKDLEIAEGMKKDKTLPHPPVPTGKAQFMKRTMGLPRASDIFGAQPKKRKPAEAEDAKPVKSVLRPSPMARRISTDDKNRGNNNREKETQVKLLRSKPVEQSDGLDALEKRLLREVGTRKPDAFARPTVFQLGFSSQPLSSPSLESSVRRPTPIHNDSEISSLALASTGSAELKSPEGSAKRPAPIHNDSEISSLALASTGSAELKSPDTRTEATGTPKLEAITLVDQRDHPSRKPFADKAQSDHSRLKEDKAKEREAIKLRKEAKGRVANWLGGVAAGSKSVHVEKTPEPRQPEMVDIANNKPVGSASSKNQNSKDKVRSSPPPIQPKPTPSTLEAKRPKALNTASPLLSVPPPEIKSPDRPDKPKFLQGKPLSNPTAERSVSPPPTSPVVFSEPSALASPRPKAVPPLENSSKPISNKPLAGTPKVGKADNRFLGFPPPQGVQERKYDVRSARGGKGGITTSVAAIWASLAEDKSNDKPPGVHTNKPTPVAAVKRPASLDVGRSKPSPAMTPTNRNDAAAEPPLLSTKPTRQTHNMVKSASVPAIVDQSHAMPHLSSTASLARPAVALPFRTKPPSLSTTLSESPSQESFVKPATAARDMAFGQARLKDLIKKYQQGAS